MLALLFSPTQRFLGELNIQQGSIQRISLAPYAEGELADFIEQWQLMGVQAEQLLAKVQTQGHFIVRLPDRLVPFWEKLCRIELAPQERFASVQTMLNASHAALQAWDAAMDKTIALNV